MKFLDRIFKLVSIVLFLSLLAACSPTFNMPISAPVSSDLKYSETNESGSHELHISDSRAPEAAFSEGVLNFNIQVNGKDIDEVAFLSSALIEELSNRGSLTKLSSTPTNVQLDIKTFKIINHRSSGFSPLVTFTVFSGDLKVNDETKRIASFIKRGKVPIWAITETGIVENTFNQPTSLLVQDLATRITQRTDNKRISDTAVSTLTRKIQTLTDNDDPASYLKVYQLGFGNNQTAIPTIINLLEDSDEYVRLAAISSLGLLDVESEVNRLADIFHHADLWQDRGMALKALADIDSTESKKIIEAEWNRIGALKNLDKESTWNKQILELYR